MSFSRGELDALSQTTDQRGVALQGCGAARVPQAGALLAVGLRWSIAGEPLFARGQERPPHLPSRQR